MDKYGSGTDYFEQYLLPYALLLGMDYDSFWFKPPGLLNAYLERRRMENEHKQSEQEYVAWLNGSYIYEAVITSLDQAFNGKKATAQYPARPRKTPAERIAEEKSGVPQVDPQVALFQAQLSVWTDGFNKKFNQQGSS